MGKVLYLLFGFIVICSGLYALYTGQSIGLGARNSPTRIININDNFVEYWISIIIIFYIGYISIKSILFDGADKKTKNKK